MSTFLILGGTGKTGRRLAQQLRIAGHAPRLASRGPRGDVVFDWRNPSTYPEALRGVEGVFVVGPGSATDWTPQLTEFLRVADAAGVARVVLLSARGVEFLPTGIVARAEDALRSGPVPSTILRPSHFAQNFTEAMFVPVDGRVIAPVGDGAEPFIDVADIAEVAAVVLADDGFDGEVLELSGPEAITFDQAVGALNAVTGHSVVFVDESDDDHIARLRAAGTPEAYVTWRMAMLRGIRSGADARVSDGVQRALHRAPTSFADWAAREAA
ncbi:NAD(P)H-binding protein [Herbiconiux sp. CPCC 205763]|uniref:NAD(P)H-binding protein n=1 Tax=Herbiconiux aconitum TaxID=2970913 RepID=A0ABT2GTX2_9MICO|nr:NAD(P)H-binding protein [Herbiconiux aconitum]MCS5719666.1 NAD(P)H-binding protein [Herbiconiux aconitum]